MPLSFTHDGRLIVLHSSAPAKSIACQRSQHGKTEIADEWVDLARNSPEGQIIQINSEIDDRPTHLPSQPVLGPVDPEIEVDDEYVLTDESEFEGVALPARDDDADAQEPSATPREVHEVPSAEGLYSLTPPTSPTISNTSSQLVGMSRLQIMPPRVPECGDRVHPMDEEVEACILRKKVTTLEVEIQDLEQSMNDLISKQQRYENERSLQLENLSAAFEKLRKDLDGKIAAAGKISSQECSASQAFLQAEIKKSKEALEMHKKISSQQHASLVAIQGAKSERISKLEDTFKRAEIAHGLAISELQQRLQKSEQAIAELSELTQKLSQKILESESHASRQSQRPLNRRAQHQQAQRQMHPRPQGIGSHAEGGTPSAEAYGRLHQPYIGNQQVQQRGPEMDEGLGLFKWLA